MSQHSYSATHELSCPNCGASYSLPANSNQVECAYCGSRFLVPESVRTPVASLAHPVESATVTTRVDAARWVRWLVIFIVVTTVVPIVCSVAAAVCGALVPLFAFLFK